MQWRAEVNFDARLEAVTHDGSIHFANELAAHRVGASRSAAGRCVTRSVGRVSRIARMPDSIQTWRRDIGTKAQLGVGRSAHRVHRLGRSRKRNWLFVAARWNKNSSRWPVRRYQRQCSNSRSNQAEGTARATSRPSKTTACQHMSETLPCAHLSHPGAHLFARSSRECAETESVAGAILLSLARSVT